MKKSIITVLLSISMTVGSIGAVPAFAAEPVAEEAASGSAEETTEGVTVSGEAGTSSTSEAAEELEEVPNEAGTSGTSEAAKEIEEVSEDASTLSTSEVAKEIEEVPEEAASAAGEVTEVSAEQKNASGSTFKPGDKMIALGKEGTTQKFPMNPKRTNGFEDYREDISGYDIWVLPAPGDNGPSTLEHNTIMTTGEYRKLQFWAVKPNDEYSGEQVMEDRNVIHYEIQGPNVKKVLREKAHDEEVFFGCDTGCLSEPTGNVSFAFDEVNSERITRRLNIPDSELAVDLHLDIMMRLTDYDLDELRQYDSAREFVEAANFMQSDEIYTENVGTERSNKGSDIVALAKERAEDHYANGYERVVDTLYANCMGIKEGSKWMSAFRKKYDEGQFSFCVKEGDTYWFAMWASNSLKNTTGGCDAQVQLFVDRYFPGIKESEYEVRAGAAFDEWVYDLYYDFTDKDLCDAWLAEMENWEGHWNNFLYGVYDKEDIGQEDAEPGYEKGNWFTGGSKYGKTTLHYPDQYDYYVKDPGVYTITATIDGCNGVITDQFVVKAQPVQTGWVQDDKGWRYIEENGQPAKNKWIEEGFIWYYFKSDGYMAVGLQKIGNAWYYFDADGVMQRGWHKIGGAWYYFKASGVMQKGWQTIDNVRYYFNADGAMQTGWQKIDNKWYYFSAGGAMQTGWQKINNVWYYLNADGVMQTGWQKIGSSWYYFSNGGAMQTGWQKINNKWYYFRSGGAMVTGRQQINGKWHTFSSGGALQ